MACTDNSSNLCMDPTTASCVDFEGALGANTKITTTCYTQSDVNTDLYAITDEAIANQDTAGLGTSCITYPLTDSKITLKTVNEVNETEICDLKDKVEALETKTLDQIDITALGLDFECLVDPCGATISNLGQLLQIMITKVCNP